MGGFGTTQTDVMDVGDVGDVDLTAAASGRRWPLVLRVDGGFPTLDARSFDASSSASQELREERGSTAASDTRPCSMTVTTVVESGVDVVVTVVRGAIRAVASIDERSVVLATTGTPTTADALLPPLLDV